eukprot:COSAG02_NODE_179_length_31090_cov_49.813785_33_plen_131_part_00
MHGSVHYHQDCRQPFPRARILAALKGKGQDSGEEDVYTEAIWPADPAVMAAMNLPRWELSAGQSVQIKLALDAGWTDAEVAADGKAILSDGEAVRSVYGLRSAADAPDMLRVATGCTRPSCPDNDNPVRP